MYGLDDRFLRNRDVFAEGVVRAPVADGCDKVVRKAPLEFNIIN